MAFFFLNLFAHIGIPLAMAAVFWLHVKRLARPRLLPPAPVMWVLIGALTPAAVAWPVPMAPQANALLLPAQVPADLFFAFWIPVCAIHRRTADGAHRSWRLPSGCSPCRG